MIKANHTFLGDFFFKWYSRIQLRRYFRQVNVSGKFEDSGKAVLVIGNHFSWWDGFIQLWLNNRLLHRKFHVMMLEEQLRKFRILSKGGAFSIQKNSRGIVESLNYSIGLLKASSNLLVIFPQGEIQTLYTQKFVFEKGIEYVIRKVGADNVDILFNVNLVDYFSHKKPALHIFLKKYDTVNGTDIRDIQEDFNSYFTECIDKQKEE